MESFLMGQIITYMVTIGKLRDTVLQLRQLHLPFPSYSIYHYPFSSSGRNVTKMYSAFKSKMSTTTEHHIV
jgi:hypothetical protein